MNHFTLQLYDATQQQRIDEVTCFVGEDDSGSFSLKAYHARFMTTLVFGLARFRLQNGDWRYLALPGGVLYFNANALTISTRHFLIDSDFERISEQLKQQLLAEEETVSKTRKSLQKMEQSMLTKLWKLQRHYE
ncbi:F0F1 ATP synthase subunit epsilon [Methylomarinum sp. Ch1-1]|uniref:F0F1 ATP synthase subunit epsilon n=1 Tax=Methylomarinum roseum TaxID=3067653 RepID=A0AAU7NZF1_9GAMM|nr:F0F1 ATP synthase subunit epsilon [Methylomarinum sp. Ch1-1]MDP4521537.1 F0F1 ATP synthase subunit epsilon [Methylomarinum sp. Ch1-1]